MLFYYVSLSNKIQARFSSSYSCDDAKIFPIFTFLLIVGYLCFFECMCIFLCYKKARAGWVLDTRGVPNLLQLSNHGSVNRCEAKTNLGRMSWWADTFWGDLLIP